MSHPTPSWRPLLERLQRYGGSEPRDRGGRALCREAAAEIAALRAVLLAVLADEARHATGYEPISGEVLDQARKLLGMV